MDEIEESGDYVYSIGLFNDEFRILRPRSRLGKTPAEQISDVSGGRTVMETDLHNLSRTSAMIAREMRNAYVLG